MFIDGITVGPGFQSVNNVASRPFQSGTMYWDHNANCVKILDANGGAPSMYPSHVSISFDNATFSAIAWVQAKMREEQKINDLIAQHPGLKDLKEKYEVMLALVQKEA